MRVLDIDLDFFLNKKASSIVTQTKRLDENEYIAWSTEDVVRFLEERCGLNSRQKICGKVFTHHDEVFFFFKELQEQNDFTLQFAIDHLDAHADLGQGDASYQYISSDILHRPVVERANVENRNGWQGLSAGNYLAFAIACRWVSQLRYINRHGWFDDIARFHFRNYDTATNIIELKKYDSRQIHQMIYSGDFFDKAMTIPPLALEPEVPFEKIDYNDFMSDGNYDFILLTQSPGYTPASADALLTVISNYISLL